VIVAESSERSAAEREAARLERERRRAKAAGEQPQFALAPDRDESIEREDGHGSIEGEDGHRSIEREEGDEVASGTRRVGWRERTAAVASTAQAAPAPAARERPASIWHRRRWLTVRVISVLALLLAAALIWFCVELFQPFHGSGHGSVTVSIPAHSHARQIGDLLERDGVVASGFFFDLRAALAGDRGKLLAGTYHVKLDMSYGQALEVLTTPPPAAKVTNVTIVPGRTRTGINTLLRSQRVKGSYLAVTRHSRLLNPAVYGAPRSTTSLEGFLYPDTYQVRVPINIGALVADQLTAFKRAFGQVDLRYAHSHHLSAYDVLIIASIIEEESATARDRPLVASVIYNRLKDGIALGMDSTTRYEFNDYTKPLTSSQLSAQSPYNTRLNKGLPPTPIGNPGRSAIAAAAHPAQTSYLYFVVKPCGNGESVFSSSYKQFLADSARYQSARTAHGGRSPAKC
jgi:uncharacterized YceG family protein